jgi:hypothetical protein
MQNLVRDAISQGRRAVHPVALAAQTRRFRSAAVAGANQTAARSGVLMKKHHALGRRLIDRQDDYLRFTTDFRTPPDKPRVAYCTSSGRSDGPDQERFLHLTATSTDLRTAAAARRTSSR